MSTEKLSDIKVKSIQKRGYYNDGGGLYLRVTATGTKSWIFRWRDRTTGRLRDLGLGSHMNVSLKAARTRSREARELLSNGLDPKTERDRRRQEALVVEGSAMTFSECAAAYVDAHAPSWRNAKHVQQWRNTLNTYVYPTIGNVSVAAVSQAHILKVLQPIWKEKTETATRVRQRIENILDYAQALGLRSAENPARWKGHLDKLLAAPNKVKKVKHHPALPYKDTHTFVTSLKKQEGIGARALEFTILTAGRTSEVSHAQWSEFDLDEKVWTVPPERMKANREHRVPLSKQALRIVKHQIGLDEKWVFPSSRYGRPMSNAGMSSVLKRMNRFDITVHGFRSTFRDWAAEQTAYSVEVCEAALAHTIRNATEAAYRRSDLMEKRAKLMEAWARYCCSAISGDNLKTIQAINA